MYNAKKSCGEASKQHSQFETAAKRKKVVLAPLYPC